ncbi:hypothetical protein MCG45_16140 [Clostridium perfringens]|uniref:hypothetical protein n=1 Tax=Clostridium perfringens TaxID=1502 RepID=UPI001F05929C|nr:hypothetical protein [Clostridium perfringens]MCH1964360.1 hypothetical protein [Clostridium perfringens]
MDILSNSKEFFENMSSEEFTNLLDEFGFDYEIANRKMSNIDRPFISMLNELPINKKDVIDNKILPLIKIIESDINFELMNLSEYNRKWYRESYQELLKGYMGINKIIKIKRNCSFVKYVSCIMIFYLNINTLEISYVDIVKIMIVNI